MLRHPDMLGKVGELHISDLLQEAERRRVGCQVGESRSMGLNPRKLLGSALLNLGSKVSRNSANLPPQSSRAGA